MVSPRFKLLICDLDNTLYNWYTFFVPSFYKMVDKTVEILGCDREKLLDDLKEVHEKYHDVEHPYSLIEARIVNVSLKDKELEEKKEILQPAFDEFNRSREETLILFPGVFDTLSTLKAQGITLVAHTDSRLFQTLFRLRFLGILEFFSHVFCAERKDTVFSNHPSKARWLDDFPMERVIELKHHQTKPNPEVLLEICANEETSPSEAVYVGDSIEKDIFMANEANVKAIWAEYCAHPENSLYDKLERISHWTQEDIDRHHRIKKEAKGSAPDFVIRESFAEILSFLI